jgi:DNA-binding transcriptional LysR family regulator
VDLITLAELGSFRKASKRREVSQSALSQHIKNLENWFGGPLVTRSDKNAELTAYGEAVVKAARVGLSHIYNTRERFSSPKQSVSFSSLHAIAIGFFPKWISSILNGSQKIRVGMMAENTMDCLQALNDGVVDFFICYDHFERSIFFDIKAYRSIVIGSDELIPVIRGGTAPEDQEFHSRVAHAFNDRHARIPLLSYSVGTFLGRIVDDILQQRKMKHRADAIYHADLAEVLKAMARNVDGVAWLPRTAVGAALQSGQLVSLVDQGGWIRNSDGLKVELPIRLFWKEPLSEQGDLIVARAKVMGVSSGG